MSQKRHFKAVRLKPTQVGSGTARVPSEGTWAAILHTQVRFFSTPVHLKHTPERPERHRFRNKGTQIGRERTQLYEMNTRVRTQLSGILNTIHPSNGEPVGQENNRASS